jgi:hypothetical protein
LTQVNLYVVGVAHEAGRHSASDRALATSFRLATSIQRIQKLYPDLLGHEIEEVLLNWIDMGYDPENYSQAQLNELDSLTERWVADHLRNATASKTCKRTRHS